MSSVHNVRNKFDCLQAIIYSLYYEEGECPTAGEIADFPGVHCGVDRSFSRLHCGVDRSFSRRALRSRLNSNQTKLNAD